MPVVDGEHELPQKGRDEDGMHGVEARIAFENAFIDKDRAVVAFFQKIKLMGQPRRDPHALPVVGKKGACGGFKDAVSFGKEGELAPGGMVVPGRPQPCGKGHVEREEEVGLVDESRLPVARIPVVFPELVHRSVRRTPAAWCVMPMYCALYPAKRVHGAAVFRAAPAL